MNEEEQAKMSERKDISTNIYHVGFTFQYLGQSDKLFRKDFRDSANLGRNDVQAARDGLANGDAKCLRQ